MYDGLPMLNLGCGKVILPAERPAHHALIDETIYSYPQWVNVDRNPESGVDCVVNLLEYPWPFEDNSFSGGLFSHFVEHIPHEIKLRDDSPRAKQLARLQDGWYVFWSEVFRVFEDGAVAHILSPYAWSAGAIADPTHTRLICEHTFTHQLSKSDISPYFQYQIDCNFEQVQAPHFSVTEMFAHLVILPGDNEATIRRKQVEFQDALMTRLNVVYEIYVQLRAVKS